MKDVIIAIDQGTTGSTALLLDQNVQVVSNANVEFPNHYPKPGWVEHDVTEIWDSVRQAIQGARAAAPNTTIRAIGITNQRESTVVWDKRTGEPLYDCVLWHDARTSDTAAALPRRVPRFRRFPRARALWSSTAT